MEKLLPCPFCGGEGLTKTITTETLSKQYIIRCCSCACEGGWGKSKTGAIKWWNMRTTSTNPGELVWKKHLQVAWNTVNERSQLCTQYRKDIAALKKVLTQVTKFLHPLRADGSDRLSKVDDMVVAVLHKK